MKSARLLLTLQLLKQKNKWKSYLKRPLKLLSALLPYLFWIAFAVVWFFVFRGEETPFDPIDTSGFVRYIPPAVYLLMGYSLYRSSLKAIDNMALSIFSPGDQSFIFCTPIDRRIAYFFAMIGQFWQIGLILLSSLLPAYIIMGGLFKGMPILALFLGLMGFFLFKSAFRFLIYSVTTRFSLQKVVRWVINIAAVLSLIALLCFAFSQSFSLEGILSGLSSPVLHFAIPVVGQLTGLIIAFLSGSSVAWGYAVFFLLLSAITLFLSSFWAQDYYEDAIAYIEAMGKSAEMVESGKSGAEMEIYHTDDNTRRAYTGTKLDLFLPLEKAFFYKALLLLKKQFKKSRFQTLLPALFSLILGIAGGITINALALDGDTVLIFAGLFLFSYTGMLGSIGEGLKYELGHIYIYLTPVSHLKVLFWVNLLPLIRAALNCILFLAPMFLLSGQYLSALPGILFLSVTLCTMRLSDKVLRGVVYQNQFKPTFLENILWMGVTVLLFFPAGALGIGGYFIGQALFPQLSLLLVTAFAGVGLLITSALLFLISSKLFDRVELI